MPWDAWESLHGGSRKWFPEQYPDPLLDERVRAWRQRAYRSRTAGWPGLPAIAADPDGNPYESEFGRSPGMRHARSAKRSSRSRAAARTAAGRDRPCGRASTRASSRPKPTAGCDLGSKARSLVTFGPWVRLRRALACQPC
jgi:hypothetical protein